MNVYGWNLKEKWYKVAEIIYMKGVLDVKCCR